MSKNIVTLGCSWAWGMGCKALSIPISNNKIKKVTREEMRVSALLSKQINGEDYHQYDINLALPSGSNDRSLRILSEWLIDKPNGDNFVFVALTQPARHEIWWDDMGRWLNPWVGTHNDNIHTQILKKYNKDYYKHFHNNMQDYERVVRIIQQIIALCEYHEVEYFITDAICNLRFFELNGFVSNKGPHWWTENQEKYNSSVKPRTDWIKEKEHSDFLNQMEGFDWDNDKHHKYTIDTLSRIVSDNPRVYLDTTWDQIIGGANLSIIDDKYGADLSLLPDGWNGMRNENEFIGNELYAEGDLGHPSQQGNEKIFKHFRNYLRKNKLI